MASMGENAGCFLHSEFVDDAALAAGTFLVVASFRLCRGRYPDTRTRIGGIRDAERTRHGTLDLDRTEDRYWLDGGDPGARRSRVPTG